MIVKSKPLDRINALLQAGLASDQRRIAYYRQVMQDPRSSFNNTIYRDLAGEILETLVDNVLNDPQLFNRLRQNLLNEDEIYFDKKALDNLVEKAEKSGIDVDVILEVYRKGYKAPRPQHLTAEQHAFNSVNAFVAHSRENSIPSTTLNTIRRVIKKKE